MSAGRWWQGPRRSAIGRLDRLAPLGVRLGNTLSPTWLKRLYTVLLLLLATDMAFKLLAGSGLLERFWNRS